MAFEVAGKPAVASDPRKCPLDDPAFRQHDEAMPITAFHDLDAPGSGARDGPGHPRSLIAAIGEDALNEGKAAACPAQEVERPVAVLHIGRMHNNGQQEAERIDEDVALAAGDLLARVEALAVDRGPPFEAAVAVWLSMIATLGLASRPARSRVST